MSVFEMMIKLFQNAAVILIDIRVMDMVKITDFVFIKPPMMIGLMMSN